MKVVVTGSSGLIGSALVQRLQRRGGEVNRLVRRAPDSSKEIFWDPELGLLDPKHLEGFDAVVHLAGAGIGLLSWSQARKETILQSRLESTRLLAEALATLAAPPSCFLSASAVGFYGDRGDEMLTEASGPGAGFRSQVCQLWEEATSSAEKSGIRVAHLRSGIVLSKKGGLLPFLMAPARLGFPPRLGSGRQFWSWITLSDEISAIIHLLDSRDAIGPFNLVSPNPVRQEEFARALAHVAGWIRVRSIPKRVLEMCLGRERASELLLSSERALPDRLLRDGFVFACTDLGVALAGMY
jgi:uncharacterized protein (TIGR01777 family)